MDRGGERTAVLWVAAGAALWGTDTVFRAPLAQALTPIHIVLYEHLILAVIVLPILIRRRRSLADISPSGWLAVLGISWIGSAAATVAFTYAIQSGNPTTAVLLQKLQPLFAIILARSLLNERWAPRFPLIALAAIAGAYLISFGGGNLLEPFAAVAPWPAALAMLAALGWGSSTVLGRWMAPKIPFDLLTSLRVLLAVPLLVLLGLSQPLVLPGREHFLPLTFMAVVPGFAGLMFYYRGLSRTPAITATIAELAFPATAALLNWIFLGAESTFMQAAGFFVVWSSIIFLRGQRVSDPAKATRPERSRCKMLTPMTFDSLQEFVAFLEQKGQLRRISTEVDPVLEAPEIAQRVLRDGGPALLFEHPKGATFPLLMNLFGTMERVEAALGRDPAEISEELLQTIRRVNPPSLRGLWESRQTLKKALLMQPRTTSAATSQQVVEEPNLTRLPVVQCWPEDAGRFITFGMVITRDPRTKRRNFGLYRLQVYDGATTGMHWQSMKGGRGHYWTAEQAGTDLEVAVVIGCSPILMLASILPLPEDVDEVAFAGFLRGRGVKMVQATSIDMLVPADAEFVLEGVVRAGERRLEGPFGDHFGHYSEAADFPVFRIRKVTRRRNPIYVATVVGKPPQEDKFIGIAAGKMIGPLIQVINPNIVDMCAYVGAGFHNLLVVALHRRHPQEALKTAMSLLGTGQLALTKVLVLVPPDQDPARFEPVLAQIWHRCHLEDNLVLVPVAPLDTLDFTSFKMHVGSKLIIDASGDVVQKDPPALREDPTRFDGLIQRWKLLEGGFLVVVVERNARPVLERLIEASLGVRFVVAVSSDVDLDDEENLQWGIFTRFDPARDMLFESQKFVGARPVYGGTVGIDATWKEGYPKPLETDDATRRLVDRRWNEYL